MDLTKYFTKETSTIETFPLESSTYFVRVRALNNRERREREQLAIAQKTLTPTTERGRKEMAEADSVEIITQYNIAAVRQFEYDKCVVDFCLPYQTRNSDLIDWKKADHKREDIQTFYDNMPQPLVEFIEDCIARVNKEGKYADEAAEIKND